MSGSLPPLVEDESAPGGERPAPTRVELLDDERPRRPIDSSWSPRKKRAVGVSLGVVALAAIGVGVWVWFSGRPPALPTSAGEAVAVIGSARFDRLDEARKRQYLAEAARLLQGVPEDERRALFEDEATRDALGAIMRNRMDDAARALARGEDPPAFPGGGPPNLDALPPEMRDMIRARINEQTAQQIMSGNAQSTGLRMEMMQRVRRGRP